MPGRALRLRHSQNNQPSALGAAYYGNTATLGQLHINASPALPTPSCEKVNLSAAAQMCRIYMESLTFNKWNSNLTLHITCPLT